MCPRKGRTLSTADVIYLRYLSGCSASEGEMTSAEAVAKDQRLGVWSSPEFVMPWDWRKSH
jgi:endonuclease YncB( thermonuclease family)